MEKKSKKVEMKSSVNSGKQNEKLTYEQLEQVANSLNQRCNLLYQQLQKAQNTIAEFNEIGVLLEILKQAEHFNSEFVDRCSNKIEELITKALDNSEKQEKEQAEEEN